MSEDGRVVIERWRRLLTLGVPLQIPETSIPYCDTDRSTLHWLGWDGFQRWDEWHSFEAGHGHYGSTDRVDLSRDALDATLADLARRSSSRVTPWTIAVQPDAVVSPREALPRVRAGEIALTRWYAPVENGMTDLVVGDGEGIYWVRSVGAKVRRVERLDDASLALLDALPLDRAAVVPASEEHRSLAQRGREHLAKHAAFLQVLATEPTRFVGPADAHEGTTRGTRFRWIGFWDAHRPGPMVVAHTGYVTAWVVAQALFADPTAQPGVLDPATRAMLSEREQALGAVHDALLGGTMAYQPNTSIASWWAWLDGVAYEIAVGEDGTPRSAVKNPALTVPGTDCASYAHRGQHPDRFHALDNRWTTALRAVLAA